MPGYGRALRRACPRCGHSPVFSSFYDLTDRCAGCDLLFEREPGYWIGAMIINTALISFLFLASMGLGMWLFWPDVPWGWLLGGVITLNAVIPVVFYPLSKTLWVALDLSFQEAAGERERR
jgi:uncharacterized protein (DUF983 family)